MTKKKTKTETGGSHGSADPEFGGLFRGLGDFVSLLGKLAEAGEKHIERKGEFRVKGLGDRGRGVYGFSIRSGIGGGGPRVEPFGNVRSSDEGLVVDPVREPLVDVFDEGSEIVVTAELPGVSEKDRAARSCWGGWHLCARSRGRRGGRPGRSVRATGAGHRGGGQSVTRARGAYRLRLS